MGSMKPSGREYSVQRSEQQWREQLSPAEYAVLRQGGTERPFTGEYWDDHTEGVYSCRACGTELFRSTEKFDSHCGWPSFFAPLAEDRVEYLKDRSMGMTRVEVRCGTCGSHLGHVFEGEGYATPTDQRYCINSISIRREPMPAQESAGVSTGVSTAGSAGESAGGSAESPAGALES